jgi:putative membrane protein
MKLTTLQLAAFAAALSVQPLMAQEMKPKPAGDAAPMMTMDKPTFVKMVTSSNEFEIRSSELAKQNADQAEKKMAADMIIADHRKAGDKLKATLEAKGGAPVEPVKLAPKHQKMLDQLQGAKGKEFDMLYLDMQAQAHMEAVGLFRTYAGSGDDQSLVGFAKETLPSLETHLGHVKMLIAEN